MAFQDVPILHDFLCREARSTDIGHRAPAENSLLEERLSPQREQQFVSARMPPVATTWDAAAW